MRKGKILLLISLFIGIAYIVYSVNYWGGLNTSTTNSGSEQLGYGIATAVVMPHLVITALAVIFNALGFFMYYRPFALVAAILYTVAVILFPMYFMFVVIEMLFCYIAFARMDKKS